MSEVQKYDPFGYDGLSALMHEDEYGEWVRVENYELAVMERDTALKQVEGLRQALTTISIMRSHECTIGQSLEDAIRVACEALSAKP